MLCLSATAKKKITQANLNCTVGLNSLTFISSFLAFFPAFHHCLLSNTEGISQLVRFLLFLSASPIRAALHDPWDERTSCDVMTARPGELVTSNSAPSPFLLISSISTGGDGTGRDGTGHTHYNKYCRCHKAAPPTHCWNHS